jgi:hypothetical protein
VALGNDLPILNYSKSARSPGLINGLRIFGAANCALTGLAGLGILLIGMYVFGNAAFFDKPTIDRQRDVVEAAVICTIGLVMAGFSIRWFLAAVRAVRRAGSEVAPAMPESPGASNRWGG